MPVYEYRCNQCGPFDQRRNAEDSSRPPPCPTCSAATKRVYTALAVHSRSGALAASNAAEAALVDRARTGEPIITGPPVGRRFSSGGHHQH